MATPYRLSPLLSVSSGPAQAPFHTAIQAGLRPAAVPTGGKPRLLVAGATGVLGNEVLRRLVGSSRFSHTEVLASEPMTAGMARVGIVLARGSSPEAWEPLPATMHTGLVMFEPPRLYYGRERSLWTPAPEQLPALARWMKRCGVRTLVVVVPHATGRLPDALKRGLANLDEQAVAALGFERLLLVRSARTPQPAAVPGIPRKVAAWMLSTLKYMIPSAEQPVRPSKLAEFIAAALAVLPAGTHIVSPEWLHQAGQSGARDASMADVVHAWLEAGDNNRENPQRTSAEDANRQPPG